MQISWPWIFAIVAIVAIADCSGKEAEHKAAMTAAPTACVMKNVGDTCVLIK